MLKRLPILLTATIRPHRTDGVYKVNQPEEERFRQYCSALQWIAKSRLTDKLVLAENSGSSLTTDLFRYCSSLQGEHFRAETLHYPFPDESFVRGKGYGEGWLINQAVCNSEIISCSNSFLKITGRYKIRNLFRFSNILDSLMFKENSCEFVCQGLSFYDGQIPVVSTALFACTRPLWLQNFAEAYRQVDDIQGWAFEAEVAQRLRSLVSNGIQVEEIQLPLVIDAFKTSDNQPLHNWSTLISLILRSKIAHLIGRRVYTRTLCEDDFKCLG
jgi:hypothetical protein